MHSRTLASSPSPASDIIISCQEIIHRRPSQNPRYPCPLHRFLSDFIDAHSPSRSPSPTLSLARGFARSPCPSSSPSPLLSHPLSISLSRLHPGRQIRNLTYIPPSPLGPSHPPLDVTLSPFFVFTSCRIYLKHSASANEI